MPNRINASLTAAQKQAALDGVSALRQILPFLVDLSPQERQRLPKIGASALPFILKCLEIARQHPEILRGSFDLTAMQTDAALAQELLPVLIAVRRLLDEIEDTFSLALIEAYGASLAVYDGVQDAVGLDDEKRDLSEQFKRKKKPEAPNP